MTNQMSSQMRHPNSSRLFQHALSPLLTFGLVTTAVLWVAPVQLSAQQPAPAAQTAQTAQTASVEEHVRYLASEKLAGRLTGGPGETLAAQYIALQLERLGAAPLPGHSTFLHPFEFTSGSKDVGTSLAVNNTTTIEGTDNIQALSFSDNGDASGNLVFAGYGLRVPDSDDFGYDSYATLDVKDKVVVVLRYFPEDTEGDVRASLARYSGIRYKALLAREHGAKAMLLVTGPHSPNGGQVMPMTFDTAVSGSGIIAASISGEVANQLFEGAELNLADAQASLDTANPHVAGFALSTSVKLDVKVEREKRTGTNVIGMLPAAPQEAGSVERPWVMVGAHFDHLGQGGGGNSLADASQRTAIHYGADDNASGTAAVLDIARRLGGDERRKARKRSIVLALWSGEELGLLGSADFTKQAAATGEPTDAHRGFKLEDVAAYINFDMVGRSRDNKLSVQATGSSDAWPGLLERSNVPVGFDLSLQSDPYLPTDSASFHRYEIPSLNFFTGSHQDYHKPSDTVDTIAYDELDRVAQLGSLVVRKLSENDEAPKFLQVQQTRQDAGSRDSVRAFTGTIPDYATEIEGLLLGGVMAGGPAEEAGLRKGDVIVKFGAVEVKNIYDYTYALDAVKVDVTLPVVFMRDGERMETEITPRARG